MPRNGGRPSRPHLAGACDLLRRFASVSLALAAYNAGPAPVERCGYVPLYPETQAYVARILGLMGGASALPQDANFEVSLIS